MGRGQLRMLGTLFTPENLRLCVKRFDDGRFGKVVAFEDGWLAKLSGVLPEGAEVEFASFRELAASTLNLAGGSISGPVADDDLIAEIVRDAVLRSPESSPFFAGRQHPGTSRRIHGALSMLREWRWSSQSLEKAAEGLPEHAAEKVRALAHIEAHVESSLRRLRLDLETRRLESCIERAVPTGTSLPRLLALIGAEATPIRRAWFDWWLDQGGDLTVVVESIPDLPGAFAGGRALAARWGVEIEPIGAGGPVVDRVFRPTPTPAEFDLRIDVCGDDLGEIEWALRGAQTRINDGARPDRIAIFSRNLAETAPLIRSAAKRLAVPVNISHREPLLANALARWASTLIQSMLRPTAKPFVQTLGGSYGFPRGVVSPPYMRLQAVTEDAFKRDADMWAAIHDAFEPAAMGGAPNLFSDPDNPFADEMGDRPATVDDRSWIPTLVAWRERAIAKERPRAEWAQLLRDFLETPPFVSAAEPSSPTAVRDRIALSEMRAVVDRRASVAIDDVERVSFAAIIREWDVAWRSAETSDTETQLGVRVGSRPDAVVGAEHVHVLGMVEGVFPRRRAEDPILHDDELALLATASGEPHPNSHDLAAGERDLFLRLCAAPTKSLTLSYSVAGDDRDNVPAFYLQEISRAVSSTKWGKRSRAQIVPPLAQCLNSHDQTLATALDRPMRPVKDEVVHDERALSRVRPDEEAAFSPAELRDALECPFQFAFRRQLKVRAHRSDSRWARLTQIPRSSTLAVEANPEAARAALSKAVELELEALRGSAEPHELRLMSARSKTLVDEWVEQEFLARSTWPKTAVRANVGFDGESLGAELKLETESIKLQGAVSAVGELGDYAVAQIYGARKSLVEAKADQMEDGAKLELGVYFAALRGKKPSAAVEMSASSGERTLFVLDRLPHQPVQAVPASGLRVVSMDQAETKFMSDVKALLARAVSRIRSNALETTPGDACEFCDYGEVCRRSKAFGEQVAEGEDE